MILMERRDQWRKDLREKTQFKKIQYKLINSFKDDDEHAHTFTDYES